MNEFAIYIRDINKLALIDVTAIYSRLSRDDSTSSGSIRKELDKRYMHPTGAAHPAMYLAMVWHNSLFVSWVGTRRHPEKFKGADVMAQTVECFTDPELRRRGYAQLGLQSLITAGIIDRKQPVAVYKPSVIALAKNCGCNIVLYCDP